MKVIEVKDVWKKYRLHYEKEIFLKEMLSNLLRRKKYYDEFSALKDINIAVRKGETVGIIGKNGSGKTTVLKLLSGITEPSQGSIEIKGRVTELLELGAGFHPEFTGRENIYLNGAILGLSRREISKKIDSIISFADIGDFIDAQVKTYSSGMHLRLGFAIAAQVDPDILLIDEVLAVGDMTFQQKCFRKIREFKKRGKTVIFVSHNLNMVKELCGRVILLDQGRIINKGNAEAVTNRYLSSLSREVKSSWLKERAEAERRKGVKWLTNKIEITNVYFKNTRDQITGSFKTGEGMTIRIEYLAHRKISNPVFGIGIYADEIYLVGPNTKDAGYKIDHVEGKGAIEFRIKSIPFTSGNYQVSTSVHNAAETRFYDYHDRLFQFRVSPGKKKVKYGLLTIESSWIKKEM